MLYEAFTAGLRAAMGRVPSRGIPRIGPVRDQSYGVRQFIVVDPGGNYIRIGQPIEASTLPTADTAGRLERALVAAVTLADSRSDDAGAAKVLESAFADDPPTAGPVAVRALVLRADVAHRLRGGSSAGAAGFLRAAAAIELDAAGAGEAADELRRATELEAAIGSPR